MFKNFFLCGSYLIVPVGVWTCIVVRFPPRGGLVDWLICRQRFFCSSLFSIPNIAWALIMLFCFVVSCTRSRRYWRLSAGVSFERRLISWSVIMIWAHIAPSVDVRGSVMCSQKHFQNMFCGSGLPVPSIHRCTWCRSHQRFSHTPVAGLHSIWPIIYLLQWFSECNMYSLNSSSHAFIRSAKLPSVRWVVSLNITSMQWNMLCSSHRCVSSILYTVIILVEVQWSFLNAHQKIFRNVDPMTNSDERSMMKHQWSHTPPKCGRINTLTHLMPGVVNMPSMETLPLWNVGGIRIPVWRLQILVMLRSSWTSWRASWPEHTFSLKSPNRTISLSIAFHDISWDTSCL